MGFSFRDFKRKVIPKEIRKPISVFTEGVEKAADTFINPQIDFLDEDILDPAGEFLEEQILDPAGEFLGEEIAQPLRRQISKATPDELQFLAGIGGGKGGAMLAALFTGNPFLIAAAAAAGNVAGDYLTTEVDEEYDPDVVSAAFSAITQGLAAAEAAQSVPGTDMLEGQTVSDATRMGGYGADGSYIPGQAATGDVRLMLDPAVPGEIAPSYSYQYAPRNLPANIQMNTAGQFEAASGLSASAEAAAAQAAAAANQGVAIAEGLNTGQLAAGLPGASAAMEGARNIGTEFLAGAQPYVDPFGTEPGTIRDILSSGATGLDAAGQIALATGKALVPGAAEFGTKLTIEMVEAMEQAEDNNREYLRQRGLRADQVRDQSRRLRRQYYNQSFQNRGYSGTEIAQVLLREGLIDRLEDYDPNDLPQDRKFGEDVTDSTLYAARGGRVGFDNGGMGGIGQFIEGQKIREEFMDKMQRGLGAMEMNMKLNDPGMFGRIRNVLNPMDDEPFFYTREEMRFPDTKKRYESMIREMDRDRAAADFEMKDKMDLVEDYMNRLDAMGTTGGMNRQKNAMGTRKTPEGDPISPDMPDGMQMDLRGGGFIPLGTKPKADDVPAMVGKNEFVLNDEAVSGIGKMITGRPDPRAGARALYKLQNEMEAIV